MHARPSCPPCIHFHPVGEKCCDITAKRNAKMCFRKTFRAINRQCSNRILIHIWSALLHFRVGVWDTWAVYDACICFGLRWLCSCACYTYYAYLCIPFTHVLNVAFTVWVQTGRLLSFSFPHHDLSQLLINYPTNPQRYCRRALLQYASTKDHPCWGVFKLHYTVNSSAVLLYLQ